MPSGVRLRVQALPGNGLGSAVQGAITNAIIHPMTTPDATTTAMAWDDGRIVALGNDALAWAAEVGVDIVDMDGAHVYPGFVDAHMHFLHVGVKRMRPDLRGAASLAEALGRIRTWLVDRPGPVIAEGWDESKWPEGRGPTKAELDELSPEPLVARRIDGHYAVANSAALPGIAKRFKENTDTKTGILLEDASLYLNEVMPVAPNDLDEAVQIACRIAHERGITALGDYSQAPFRDALVRAAARGTLTVRVASCIYVQQLEAEIAAGFRTGRPSPGPDGDSPWLADGGLKVFLDGSLGGHTALLHEPYQGTDTCGMPIWTPEESQQWFEKAHAAGIQIHAHAIGDAAIDQALDGMAALPRDEARRLRHRIEHYELPTDEAVARTMDLGVIASCQPNFVGEWSAPGGMYERRLGKRYVRNNRYKTWASLGMDLAFGSDGMPFGALYGVQAACNHPVAEERLSWNEAVWHYTAGWSLHQEWGRLEVGSWADWIVISGLSSAPDPTVVGEPAIEQTWAGGTKRFAREPNAAPLPDA